jgi:hypothetical protein
MQGNWKMGNDMQAIIAARITVILEAHANNMA